MANFKELTLCNTEGKKTFINLDKVIRMDPLVNSGTRLFFTKEHLIDVNEKAQDIVK
ncbi:hypothetical protein [Myroides sp.]|uniref:hypothetical protein n=1 Tax=Myroides sp. TaxID=1874736 RepID=UPI0028AAEE1F|nr:hypothetical protein [Myroides sp.]